MNFWFVHSSEVSVRQQIVTQVTLGILSGELAPGDRLPSTRELARRFHLHANTVSAAYQQLETEGWVNTRRGSGVFVRAHQPSPSACPNDRTQLLNHLFNRLLRSASKLQIPLEDIRDFARHWLNGPPATRFLLVEPRQEVRDIVLAEINNALPLPASACSTEDPELTNKLNGAVVLALPSQVAQIRTMLPSGTELITLRIRSASSAMNSKIPVPPDALIGIASSWPQFLDTARTMLLATGVASDALLIRNAAEEHWQEGLDQTAGVVCDVLTSERLHASLRPIPFHVLAESAVDELRSRAQVASPRLPLTPKD